MPLLRDSEGRKALERAWDNSLKSAMTRKQWDSREKSPDAWHKHVTRARREPDEVKFVPGHCCSRFVSPINFCKQGHLFVYSGILRKI